MKIKFNTKNYDYCYHTKIIKVMEDLYDNADEETQKLIDLFATLSYSENYSGLTIRIGKRKKSGFAAYLTSHSDSYKITLDGIYPAFRIMPLNDIESIAVFNMKEVDKLSVEESDYGDKTKYDIKFTYNNDKKHSMDYWISLWK